MPRRDLALAAALGAILALPAVGYFAWLARPPTARDRAVVTEVHGGLQVRRPGQSWHEASSGTGLARGDELRVSGEHARVDAAGRFLLTLRGGSLAVLEAPTELTLEAGEATLEVPAGSTVTVHGQGDAAAEVSGAGARFRVAASPGGLSVEALAGQVRLRGAGAALDLPTGRTGSIPAGAGPEVGP